MRSKWVAVGVVAVALVGVRAIAVAHGPSGARPGASHAAASSQADHVAAVVARAADDDATGASGLDGDAAPAGGVGGAVGAAGDVLEPRTVDMLLARLGSDDPFVVLDAADGLAARKAIHALPALVTFDLHASPDAAPSVIDAVGRLGGATAGPARAEARTALVRWLAEEKTRGAPESAGNALALYEALGETRDREAATVLEGELRDPAVPRAAKTVVADALARIGAPSTRGVLVEVRAHEAAAVVDDAFEDEVRGDLLASLDRALAVVP